MTADEVVKAALARCTDLGVTVPSARSVLYRRIGIRQGQIFSKVTRTHPDFFGVEATVALTNGAYVLSGLVPKAEQITDVRIGNPGSSGHREKDVVNIVVQEDVDAFLSPRAVIRDQVLKQIATDLVGVATLTVYYAKRPAASSAIAPTTAMELPEQFQDLLVIDLAKQLIRKALDVEPQRRDGWMDLLSGEEKELFGSLDEHVRYFAAGEQRRFRPPSAPIAGTDSA